MQKRKMFTRRGIVLHDMTPPTKAIDTEEGRICIGCGGDPQPIDHFPKTKNGRGPRCRTCINAKAREKKAEKKSDFFMF